MAENSLFWPTTGIGDGTAGGVSADELWQWLRSFLVPATGSDEGGVNPRYLNQLAVSGASSPVSVATGAAHVYGIPYTNTTPVAVAVPTPSAAARIDRIVLRADWAAQVVRVARVAGAEGGGAPALTQVAGSIWEMPLAQIAVAVDGAITVTDQRMFVSVVGYKAVDTSKLADSAVTTGKIAAQAVTTAKIADFAVTWQQIADNTIGAGRLADGAIQTAKLATNAVTTAKIAPSAVTSAELADSAVTNTKIANLSISTPKLFDSAITTAKLATGAVTAAKIANKTITAAEIADNTITAAQIGADAVGSSELADNAVDTGAIQNLAVTNAKLANLSVTAAKIANKTITAAEIADNTVGAGQIAANAVGSSELADNAVYTAAIQNSAVTNEKLGNDAVTRAKLHPTSFMPAITAANPYIEFNNTVSALALSLSAYHSANVESVFAIYNGGVQVYVSGLYFITWSVNAYGSGNVVDCYLQRNGATIGQTIQRRSLTSAYANYGTSLMFTLSGLDRVTLVWQTISLGGDNYGYIPASRGVLTMILIAQS